MAEATQTETLSFQAEARQLLNLMIHSLYSNREIFLRELISNASDAIDKLRFEVVIHPELANETGEFHIRIDFDKDAKTLTISDNGIGMSRAEAISHLGTIARSGTAEFIAKLPADQKRAAALIGQFGVGFYSAFIVSQEVEVVTRRIGEPVDGATRWRSTGEGVFTVEPATRDEPGTDVVLHLKDDAVEFADSFRLRTLVRKYSDHIGVPVEMRKSGKDASGDWESVNQAKALWTRPRADISDEEYRAFYKHVSHDFSEPLTWSHNRVEGKLEYTSLMYVPKQAPFDLWNRDAPRGLKLYVQRVFIMDDAEQFLPLYLRFVKGIVDCNDLPLNISRELLQEDERVTTIRNALTKRVIEMLSKLATNEVESYRTFWKEFGQVLKEGASEDFGNRDAIMKLLRFSSTHTDDTTQTVSLQDYVSRLKDKQDKIYYVVSDSFATARANPQLEAFRKHGIEVLLLSDRIDEWFTSSVTEFDGKKLQDITRGELDLPGVEEKANDAGKEPLLERVKEALGDRVTAVRRSTRLVDSPACVVLGDYDVGPQMRRIMLAAGQSVPDAKPTLELNLEHPLVGRLDAESDEARFGELAKLLLDQAKLAGGAELDDPASYVKRVNDLLLELLPRDSR
jgi:molecular chaperone HtpG